MSTKYIKDAACGFYRLEPLPTQEEVDHYYREEFYAEDYPQCNDSSLLKQQEDYAYNCGRFDDILHIVQQHYGDIQKKTLLDIGCGYGEFLLYAKERGMSVKGMEVFEESARYLKERGIEVTLTQLADNWFASFAGERFDVVSMLNVLEHLRNPEEVLCHIREYLLAEKGMLVLDVPNDFNPLQEIAQQVHGLEPWWVAAPTHINYFTPQSLEKLLEKCGYTVVQCTASFPLELFLLMGRNYVGNPEMGRQCHKERVLFEENMRKYGGTAVMRRLYQALAKIGLGRQTMVFATPKR